MADELARLNAAYEARFGFRYCVFVAGRPRAALLPEMAAALEADRAAEIAPRARRGRRHRRGSLRDADHPGARRSDPMTIEMGWNRYGKARGARWSRSSACRTDTWCAT